MWPVRRIGGFRKCQILSVIFGLVFVSLGVVLDIAEVMVQLAKSILNFLGFVSLVVFLICEGGVCQQALQLLSRSVHATAAHEQRQDITSGQAAMLGCHTARARLERKLVFATLISNLGSYAGLAVDLLRDTLALQGFDYYGLFLFCWSLSSIFNDVCTAHMNGLFMFYVPGIEAGAQSAEVWKVIAAAGRNQTECEQLETMAYSQNFT